MTRRLPGLLALTSSAAFFGIALYINLAEQPARLVLPDTAMLAQWQASFAVGIKLQGAMTVIAGLLGLLAWYLNRSWLWLAGGLLMLVNWPWTLLMIAPINDQLTVMPATEAIGAARKLVEQWGQLHGMRTLISFTAMVTFLAALVRQNFHTD